MNYSRTIPVLFLSFLLVSNSSAQENSVNDMEGQYESRKRFLDKLDKKIRPRFGDAVANEVLKEFAKKRVSARMRPKLENPTAADLYFSAYLELRKVDAIKDDEEIVRALQIVLAKFKAIKEDFPIWKPDALEMRIKKIEERIADLRSA